MRIKFRLTEAFNILLKCNTYRISFVQWRKIIHEQKKKSHATQSEQKGAGEKKKKTQFSHLFAQNIEMMTLETERRWKKQIQPDEVLQANEHKLKSSADAKTIQSTYINNIHKLET